LVQIVNGSAQNLCAVLDDVLELSDHGVEGDPSPDAPFNAAEVGRQALAFFESDAIAKGLEVQVDLGQVDQMFLGQPASLRQILRALVSNAVKFTQSGRVGLSGAARASGKRQTLTFTVQDTGV